MKKNFLTVAAMTVVAFFVSAEIAKAADISFSGQVRTRWEYAEHLGDGLVAGGGGDARVGDSSDDFGHAVYRFTSDGEQLMVIETANNPADTGYVWGDRPSDIVRSGPPFNFPTWVPLSPEGELYVTDGYGNARVHKFSPEGQLLFSWGEPGAGIGQFETPHSVHVDKDGWVYVADRQNCRIQIFNSEGEYIEQWSDIYWPCDMCADTDGNLYVAEIGGIFMNLGKEADFTSPNPRITIRDMSGNIKVEWGEEDPTGEGRFFSPHSIAVDSQGNLYVGEVSTSYSGGQTPLDWRAFRKFARV